MPPPALPPTQATAVASPRARPPNPLPRPRFEGEAQEGRRVARTLQARGRRRERQRGSEGKKKNDNARVLDIWVRSNGVEELLSGVMEGKGKKEVLRGEKSYKTTEIHYLKGGRQEMSFVIYPPHRGPRVPRLTSEAQIIQ
ncbi:hypothetical protein E2C01_024424 [Portunus trituberculatus]|uniref:Uncharacterized protein n=1 Tax=Portunus trituberculatus TaxID=210409 RepID=A0A5B7ECN5_PORTR|nr:hypothetical protein [Portunus trituberculatus]